jgi:hypothetical protein
MPADAQIRETPPPPFAGRHYSVQEIAKLWGLHADTVRRIFSREAGVIAIGRAVSARGKHGSVTLRIPQDVLERVYRRLQLPGGAR